MTIGEKYKELAHALAPTGEGEAEARTILAHVCGCDFGSLYLRFLDTWTSDAQTDSIVQQRLDGMPLAYILGVKPFYGREFSVDSRVLIPRYDSECVVERAVALADADNARTALDLCCGSGCLGITLLLESGIEELYLSDISADALDVARANARKHNISSTCHFIESDLLDRVDAHVDIILCNPPYISEADYRALDAQMRDHEPALALLAANDGYAFYQRLIPQLGAHLNPGGCVVLETGDTQAETVAGMLAGANFIDVGQGCDIVGRPRFVWGRLP